MQTPDYTLAQKVATFIAGLPLLANLAFAFGLYDISPEQVQVLQDTLTWGAVLAGLLAGPDAVIRYGRSQMLKAPVQNLTVLDPSKQINVATSGNPATHDPTDPDGEQFAEGLDQGQGHPPA